MAPSSEVLVVGLSHALGMAFAWLLAAFVLRSRPEARANQLLTWLLFAEGLFQALMMVLTFYGTDVEATTAQRRLQSIFPLALAAIFVASVLYLVFLTTIDSPLARPFRRRGVRGTLWGFALVQGLVALEVAWRNWQSKIPDSDPLAGGLFVATALMMAFASLYGLAACISAWRRSAQGSVSRTQAAAFVLAFGGRDLLFTVHLAGGPVIGNLWHAAPPMFRGAVQACLGLATAVFALFLAYGLLRSQLFDVDLRVKLGIRRGTVVTIILVVALASAKIAEFYLSKTYGFVAGGAAAGVMLFLVPRLNKMGDKVANAAMPQVQPTNAYLSFKKLEVYRAAVESASEVGLDDKQRAMLDRLRGKLGLSQADTDALEAEMRESNGVPEPAAAAS